MTIKINGTNTNAQPSITGTDTDTGVVYGDGDVKLISNGNERVVARDASVDVKINSNDDQLSISNTAGDTFTFAPGRGLDDWSRHIFTLFRKSYQADPTDIRATDQNMMALNAAGTLYNYGNFYAGFMASDENVSTTTYNPDDAKGIIISQGITDRTNYRASFRIRTRTDDSDDLACFYYLDSGSATTAVDYDQHQTLKMNGTGRIWAKYPMYSGRVESDETTPNSVYTNSTTNGFYSYYGSGYTTYLRSRNTDNSDAVFYADTGGGVVIKFQSNGDGRFDGGADIGAASDYAEFFEWEDANPSNEDRRGLSVVLSTDGKIREATASDATSDIIGIVSANPAVVGDSAYLNWQGRHLKDEWGSWVTVEEEFLVWNKQGTETNEEGVKVPITQPDITDPQCAPEYQVLVSEIAQHPEIPQYAIDNDLRITRKSRVTNPDFDPNVNYTPRVDRPEWDAIGLMGKLWLKPGQITGDRWLKLKDGNNGLTYWLVR